MKLPKLQPPFKNEQNQRYSNLLFLERFADLTNDQKVFDPPFTLNKKVDGYICMREEYISDADPTGYTTATRLLGDYAYWKHLQRAQWFRDALASWDEELDAKIKAEGLFKIRELATGDDAKALAAAKYLANGEYRKTGSKRGRPSKEEVEGELQRQTANSKQLEEDAARIRAIK